MCGILGVCNTDNAVNLHKFKQALLQIKHRGTDFHNSSQLDDGVILGHTRLSIIDLSATNHQPFSNDERYCITYNGEVYNYLELKKELELAGVLFKTQGDTEVVLQAYKIWGGKCVNKFNGMWSFAIYDKQKKSLFCSRDRFGVKPFSYYHSKGEFIFSSEIKPILKYKPAIKTPNYNVIANYINKSVGAQTKETWFKNIYRLPPAHNLVWENGKLTTYKYWDYPKKVDKRLTFETAQKEFESIFLDAVNLRMRSDVKVGSTLSAGLDSSSIVGTINSLGFGSMDTYTAYSPNDSFTKKDKEVFKQNVDFDESIVVKRLVQDFDVNPNFIKVSFENYLNQLSEAIYYLESGHSSPAIICIHQIYKKAAKDVKVLLEGQGADELLAGYVNNSFPDYVLEQVKRGEFVKLLTEIRGFIKIYSLKYMLLLFLRSFDHSILNKIKNIYSGINIFNRKAFKYKYLKDNPKETGVFDQFFNKSLYKRHSGSLVNLLHYGDALSMAESIECRLPFMDYRLVELGFKLPFDYKLQDMQGKYIQRKALEKHIPEYISKSLIKIGFATPLDRLIKNSREIEDVILNQPCGKLFDEKKVKKLYLAHKNGRKNHSPLLFRILSAKIWYKIFFEGEKPPVQGV